MAGTVLGTAAYMAPEQAKGKRVDKRADIWSWGVVLYELLTGERLFRGDEAADTLAQVLTKEPNLDWVPPQARKVLRRCLEKDPGRRLRDIGDVSILLDAAPGRREEIGAKVTAQSALVLPWAIVALFAVAAVLGLVAYFRPTSASPQVLKVSVTLPEKVEFGDSPPAVSPVGVASPSSPILTEKTSCGSVIWTSFHHVFWLGADHPFWSPDSRFVGFFAGGKLKKIAADGGPAVTLCDAANGARGGSWSKRDIILFTPSPNSGVFRVPAAGGSPTLVKKPGRFPWFLPDGRHFLYTRQGTLQGPPGLYFADLDSNAEQRILEADTNAVYAPPGYLLFMREGSLLAQSFDSGSGKTAGEMVPVAEQVGSMISNVQGQFSASQNPAQKGVLVYTAGNPLESQLTWYDRAGNALGVVGKPASSPRASISRDGSMLAIDRADPRTGVIDVWLLNIARGAETRLTFHESRNRFPLWSPDGRHIVFNSGRNLVQRVVTGPGQNSGSEDLLDSPRDGEAQIIPVDWSRDGRYIVEQVDDQKTKTHLWVLPLVGDRKAFPYLRTESNELWGQVSPNGRWLAYASDESRRFEVYVQTFPNPGDKSQVSIDGGTLPVWSRNGKELFYIAPDGKMMAASVKGAAVNDSARFEARTPTALFDVHLPVGVGARYDVGNDGRFLIAAPIKPPGGQQITVVVNWMAALKKITANKRL